MEVRQVAMGALAYLVPTFLVGFTWHLKLFAGYYDELQIYRADKIIPFGFIAIATQGVIFSLIYGRFFRGAPASRGGPGFAALAGLLSWTFTTLTVAAKHPMTSISGFVLIETAFTLVQFVAVAPLMVLAWKAGPKEVEVASRSTADGVR
jgi:hypothetical protein